MQGIPATYLDLDYGKESKDTEDIINEIISLNSDYIYITGGQRMDPLGEQLFLIRLLNELKPKIKAMIILETRLCCMPDYNLRGLIHVWYYMVPQGMQITDAFITMSSMQNVAFIFKIPAAKFEPFWDNVLLVKRNYSVSGSMVFIIASQGCRRLVKKLCLQEGLRYQVNLPW